MEHITLRKYALQMYLILPLVFKYTSTEVFIVRESYRPAQRLHGKTVLISFVVAFLRIMGITEALPPSSL